MIQIQHMPPTSFHWRDVKCTEPAGLENLGNLSMAKLRRLWHEIMGRKDPPGIRCLLLCELAWHDQQVVQDGMDAQTRTGAIKL